MQQSPILQTKLYIPPVRPELVSRPRLIDRLNEGLYRKLTLISAPAGFGRTTLVSEWISGCGRPAAWLTLDEGDSDPTRFLTYVVAALQTLALRGSEGIAARIGEGVLGLLQSSQPPPTESILTALLNEITTVPDSLVLVLDDYHVIDAQPVDASTSVDGTLTFAAVLWCSPHRPSVCTNSRAGNGICSVAHGQGIRFVCNRFPLCPS